MPELEDRLTALAPAIAWPPTPQLRVALPDRRLRVGWGRPLALAATAVLIVAAALLAFPPSRDAIANWVNLHTIFQRVPNVPSPSPHPSGPLGERLGLGQPTTLEKAQGYVSWHIVLPSSLGQPDEVYYQAPGIGPSSGEVTLVYASRPGIKIAGQTGVSVLVTEARGKVNEQFFGKMLGPDATVEPINVAGHQGYWISGTPHGFVFVDESGSYRDETMRLATNTLIFDDSGTIVRIEGDMTKDQAMQIATSMS